MHIETHRSGRPAVLPRSASAVNDSSLDTSACVFDNVIFSYSLFSASLTSPTRSFAATQRFGADPVVEHSSIKGSTAFLTPAPLVSEQHSYTEEDVETSSFMLPPSEDVGKRCLEAFIDATSNSALQQKTCASCARLAFASTFGHSYTTSSVPNPQRLRPYKFHPKHVLFDGLLLHPSAMTPDNSFHVCEQCLRSLRTDKVPRFSLANGMWVGEIPTCLRILTLPERILICKVFTASYIVKLYPKVKGASYWMNDKEVNSALRGNVSSYPLDVKAVASLAGVNTVLPPPVDVLADIIAITLIGPNKLPERTLPDCFTIVRERVRAALMWLRANNPLYADIVISEENLAQLPEQGVPEVLCDILQHSSDTEALEREKAGYVPEESDLSMSKDSSMMDLPADPLSPYTALGFSVPGEFGSTVYFSVFQLNTSRCFGNR